MSHKDFPFKIHLSIVKKSQYKNGKIVSTYLINDSNIFDNIENYEIEIEFDYNLIKKHDKFKNLEFLLSSLRNVIKFILSAIQQSNFPIGNIEINKCLYEYLKIIGSKKVENKSQDEKLNISKINFYQKLILIM